MIPSIAAKPIMKTSYTQQGNEYKESNIGKYVAGASVTGATVFYGGKSAFNGAKKAYGKAKTIKMDFSKFKKPDFKAAKENVQKLNKKVNKETITNFIKDIPAKIKNLSLNGVKLGKKSLNFVKDNAKKVNKENLKKAGQAVVEFAKKPSVKYAAGVVAAFAGIIALGVVADAVANKINAKKADKA